MSDSEEDKKKREHLRHDAGKEEFELVDRKPKIRHLFDLLKELNNCFPDAEKELDEGFIRPDSEVVQLREENQRLGKEKELISNQLLACKSTEKDLEKLREEVQQHKGDNSALKNTLESNEEVKRQLKKAEDDLANARKELKSYYEVREKLKATEKELDDTKRRLSQQMGDKVTDGNPNIADLSDKNRPTKLGERFQELYDNQWTDAFEIIQGNVHDEEKAISMLLAILMDTMDFCKERAENQLSQIKEAFLGSKEREIPKSVFKLLKDCRKSLTEGKGKEVYKDYEDKLRTSMSEKARITRNITPFVKECFDICWLMAVQDPPLVFYKEGRYYDPFNNDMYKAYTATGSKLLYVVWPALLLQKDGPVLCKGVAQGNGDSKPKSPARQSEHTHGESHRLSTSDKDGLFRSEESSKINTKYQMPKDQSHDRDGVSTESSTTGYASNLYKGITTEAKVDKYEYSPGISRDRTYQQSTIRTRLDPQPKKSYHISNDYMTSRTERPSERDMETFLRYKENYGDESARVMMGSDKYDRCLNFMLST